MTGRTSPAGAIGTLPTTRRELLTAIKRSGETRSDELAAALGISVSAVRQHLRSLSADGLVEHRQVRDGPGRPSHLYRLSDGGEGLFPRTYGELTLELLGHVEDEGPGLVDKLFERRRRARVERAEARLAGRTFVERVRELTRILDEDGYLAELVELPDGSFRVVEHNCAIRAVAERYGSACGTELDFIREALPDARIERVAHLMAGAHTCAYAVAEAPLSVRRPSSNRTPRKPSPTS